VHAIETGHIQALIAERAYHEQRKLESGERVVVGVNKHRREEARNVEFYEVDEEERGRQIERVRRARAERDAPAAARALEELRSAAQGTANLMPYLTECAKAYCTMGEMADVLRAEFGEFREPAVV